MTLSRLPIFINGAAVQAAAGSSLGAVLAGHDPALLEALLAGVGTVTDARGLPVDPDAPVHAGAIYRVFRRSQRDESVDV